ncbi:ORF33a [Fowl aviadenovirus E]|uniref:ORF33a n=2 Tax=Fowl aviadenovirus E TaxID=190065 RepID=A0A7G3VXC9_ADEG8|nr:ORF33a [Fowl aviadenovirus E]ABR53713.1 ORF33a [Fowl aviadenovirus 8]ADE58419.1 ORF33a [Fowl aviadenovirus E]
MHHGGTATPKITYSGMFRKHLRHRYCDTLRVREKGTRPSPATLHLRTAGDAHCERTINLRRCVL